MNTFERYMRKEHSGKANAVKSMVIEARFHCKGAEVRRMVNELRCKGVPICSSNQGYYYATSNEEIQETILSVYILSITSSPWWYEDVFNLYRSW